MKLNILFTSGGRRVALIKAFKEAFKALEIDGKILVVDASENSAARYVADIDLTLPKIDDPNYINELLRVCKQHSVNLVIPLIDTELPYLAKHKSIFEDIGTTLLLSSYEAIQICEDKRLTHKFLLENGFNTAKVFDMQESTAQAFPLFIKPANGSSSVNAFRVDNPKELDFFCNYIPNPLIQEFIDGTEYTIDILVDFASKVRCVVPRLRMETRAGEISKGVTVKNPLLIDASKALVEKMPPTLGCITVQCFLTDDNRIIFIEINPRFGGGFPLSFEAGANFPLWILQMYLKQRVEIELDGWKDGVKMLRYDDAIFLKEKSSCE